MWIGILALIAVLVPVLWWIILSYHNYPCYLNSHFCFVQHEEDPVDNDIKYESWYADSVVSAKTLLTENGITFANFRIADFMDPWLPGQQRVILEPQINGLPVYENAYYFFTNRKLDPNPPNAGELTLTDADLAKIHVSAVPTISEQEAAHIAMRTIPDPYGYSALLTYVIYPTGDSLTTRLAWVMYGDTPVNHTNSTMTVIDAWNGSSLCAYTNCADGKHVEPAG